jgi:hypothetical protein
MRSGGHLVIQGVNRCPVPFAKAVQRSNGAHVLLNAGIRIMRSLLAASFAPKFAGQALF